LVLDRVNFLDEVREGDEFRVKIRFHHQGARAQVVSRDGDHIALKFLEPQRAITKGQAAVFYKDRQLIGGGWIH